MHAYSVQNYWATCTVSPVYTEHDRTGIAPRETVPELQARDDLHCNSMRNMHVVVPRDPSGSVSAAFTWLAYKPRCLPGVKHALPFEALFSHQHQWTSVRNTLTAASNGI